MFPNGESIVVVRKRLTGSGFYYTRFHQVLKLYRNDDTQTPVGTYCCRIPDSGGEIRTFCAYLIGEYLYYVGIKFILLLLQTTTFDVPLTQ